MQHAGWTCNSRKGGIEEAPPPSLAPDSSWDGLSGLFVSLADSHAEELSTEDRKWLAAFRREQVMPREQPLREGIEAIKQFRPQHASELDSLLSSFFEHAAEGEGR